MKHILLLAAFASFFIAAGEAQAARLDSRKMTCRDLTGDIAEQGSAVVQFTKNRWEKIYANNGYCEERGNWPAHVPTLDNPKCFVGFACKSVHVAGKGDGGVSIIGVSAPYPSEDKSGR